MTALSGSDARLIHDLAKAMLTASRPGQVRGIVISRTGRGFTERDLEFADLARSLIEMVSAHDEVMSGTARRADPSEHKITPREMAVLALLDEGLTARAIGRSLRIAERTAVKHKENLYRKLRVHDRVTALNRARTLGLLPQRGPYV